MVALLNLFGTAKRSQWKLIDYDIQQLQRSVVIYISVLYGETVMDFYMVLQLNFQWLYFWQKKQGDSYDLKM